MARVPSVRPILSARMIRAKRAIAVRPPMTTGLRISSIGRSMLEWRMDGSSQYVFPDPRGNGREITVFTHRPATWTPDGPVVLVMHGRNRNGADYRDWWIDAAGRHGALIAVPEFSEAHYMHPDAYNYGAMIGPRGDLRPRAEWLFPVVDRVFEDVRGRAGS